MSLIKLSIKEEFRKSLTTEQLEDVDKWLSQCSTLIQEETDKMMHDLKVYGTCAMKDGKHISLSDIYKNEYDFFCEGCATVTSHKVVTVDKFTMYVCDGCEYKEDKALIDLLIRKGE